MTSHANPEEDQCVKCGNVDTDQILQIVEAKVVDEQGRATRIRKVTPKEWAEKFHAKLGSMEKEKTREKQALPDNNFSIPGLLRQSVIFFTRDLLSKLADKQYIIISLLGPPLLSLILAYFTRHSNGDYYTFGDNENIPSFMFMCIITSLFFGMMVSSEEIVKDRKLLKRESFLNLSWFSYLNSKIMILFIISAIQTISFVLIGNLILGIKGMAWPFWLVLFTTSCTANLLGLNLSSAFNSVITIYILIPFFIIPQLLFSGVLVKFDKLHIGRTSTREYVPVLGDIMTARWSFEAMAVKQFRDNKWERNFFAGNMKMAEYTSYSQLIDDLELDLLYCMKYRDTPDRRDQVSQKYFLLDKYINELSGKAGMKIPDSLKTAIVPEKSDLKTAKAMQVWLKKRLKPYFIDEKTKFREENGKIEEALRLNLGADNFEALRTNFENKQLKDLMVGDLSVSGDLVVTLGDKKISKVSPGYMKAASDWGRSHFYAPYKRLGNKEFDTFRFNLLVIWLVTFFLYIVLYFRVFARIINYIGGLRFEKSET